MKYLSTILFFLFLHAFLFAQDTGALQRAGDSPVAKPKTTVPKDTFKKDPLRINAFPKDSIKRNSAQKSFVQNDSLAKNLAVTHISDSLTDTLKRDSSALVVQPPPPAKKALKKINAVQLMQGTRRAIVDRDVIFYILIFLIFLLGLIRTSFPRYFDSIFSLSFQATFRQTQTREQMAQNFFPAFMLNVLFVLCGGLFITLFAKFNQLTLLPFWQLFVYSTAILLIVYLVKYIVISFTGWVFNAKEAASEYRFVVFLINKLLGVLLIPLLFLIAYGNGQVKSISATIVICLAIFSLAIRYLVSLSRIRKNLSITAFHFFIYLCAVEIMPLLVIYKVLFQQTSNR